jgi:Putative beta-barrel porin-2, OmpL-like. bbp2
MSRRIRQRRLGAGVVTGLALLVTTRGTLAQPSVPEPPPPTEPWYDAVRLRAFADAYANANWSFPKPQSYAPPTRSWNGTEGVQSAQGFALSWVGLDAGYEPDPVGGMVSLRLGPMAKAYAGADRETALEYVKQAFASWRPGGPDGMLTLDFGKFDTIYGVEVAESQDNMNYTSGVLYGLAQPRFHTGLRATAELLPELSLVALVVNGWNNSIDNNVGKTYGLQAHLSPSEAFSASIGWIGGPEQDDTLACPANTNYDAATETCAPSPGTTGAIVDRGGANSFEAWRHLFDLVVALQPTERFSLVLNGDYGVEGVRSSDPSPTTKTAKWYGAALMGRYQLSEVWAVAARGEYVKDRDGRMLAYQMGADPVTDASIVTGTLTIEARPTDNLILRLENRGDFVTSASPDQKIFREKLRDTSDKLFTTTLGVVVTTN